ncbi:MAG TPA: DUF255 domain-containing protein [Thermoanaerobaculia bacterium]|nr:DUF255 domain-containing protein [Thermoanaerobaculia bacterium]
MTESAASHAANRLARESSPYLLLHAHNPVDWYPWGPEALARAKEEQKPIFLSVGYSTCYWCHVMERESFTDPKTAALMNEKFVNVKLDREERPELDEIYMTATQILTSQGGWPNSVFLTPDLLPFYAGTYFPPEDRQGRPGFRAVLAQLAEAWATRRDDVIAQGVEMEGAMRRYLEQRNAPASAPPAPVGALRAAESQARRFDSAWGGFGGAPKFPSPSNLHLLAEVAGEMPAAGPMLALTLDQMARGGIYDQIGGGFHRYATDREWKIPHFEKMLYDNGLLLEIYAREHARTGGAQAARVVRETAAFLAREMTSPEGAFWSAIDAETDGHEGAFYVWTRPQLEAVLGREDTPFLAPLYGFDRPPFFEESYYVLHQPLSFEEVAERRRMPLAELLGEVVPAREKLFAARAERKRPATDDKILADWNGTAIAGLAVAGELLAEPSLVAAAARAAEFVLENMRPDGTLHHAWRGGVAKIPAFLSDYAFLVHGLLALHSASGEARWLEHARELTAEQIARLGDSTGGFYTSAESDDVLFRSKDVFDGALPASNAIAIDNLLGLFEQTGDRTYLDTARSALASVASLVSQHPEGVKSTAVAARRYWRLSAEIPGDEPVGPSFEELASQAERLVQPQFELSEPRVDGWRKFALILTIEPGWHVNANPASAEFLVPTLIEAEGARLQEVVYPEGREVKMAYGEGPLSIYEGTVEIVGELLQETEAARLMLTYQACDESRCLPPITRLAVVQ